MVAARVQRARTGQARQVALSNVTWMEADAPRVTALQERLGWPCGQVAVRRSQSMAKPVGCENWDHGRLPGATGWAANRAWARKAPRLAHSFTPGTGFF